MNPNPVLADLQERLYILATVALPLIARDIDRLNEDDLDLIYDCIMDFGGVALKLDEIQMLEEALTQGE